MSDEIPQGWSRTTIDKVLAPLDDGRVLHHGWSPQCLKESSPSSDVWGVLKTTAIQPGRFLPEHNKQLPDKLKPQPQLEVRAGDILLTCAGPRVRCGVPCLVRETRSRLILSGKMYRFRARPDVMDPRFLELQLLSQAAQTAIDAMKTGISDSGLNLTHGRFKSLPVTVAPLPAQRQIVAAIDAHFSRLDAATATLERVQRNLERYRASVLKAAVEGRLVPTEAELAKKEGRTYEPASVLLKRILTERRRRWEEAELAKLTAKGKKPTDDKWRAKYEEPAPPDVAGLPELPEGWCWATAASLYWDAGYGTSGKCTPEASGPPVLRIPNVQDQALDLSDLKFSVDPGTLAPDGAVEPGDFVFIRTNGSVNLIGRGAVIIDPPPRECFFASYLIRLRLARVEHLCRWFAFAWHTSVVRDQLVRDAASSAGQHNVSLSAASKYLVPLPPAREQERILAEVDRLETGRARTAHDTQVGRDRIVRLRQSILKWAFEGRLVESSESMQVQRAAGSA